MAKQIIESGSHIPYWVDDMFTPSGFAHIGSLRGPLVHDLIYRALQDARQNVVSTYVFNDFDPIDGLPQELMDTSKDYFGFPLRTAPSPVPGYENFAAYFTSDFETALRSLGVQAKFLSSWDMYHEGKFNQVIREALDNAARIQDVYQRVSGSKKREKGWLPLQVICEKCGRLGTTRVHDWDGDMVTYTCEPSMVTWAKGCGNSGKISPFDGHGKLPWKVDWPAHWKVMGVTIEGAGKDHSSAGGSRDIARELCKDVFHYPDPFNVPYEFFLIGGKKMSSSKGLGLKARDLTTLLPPTVARFLFVHTDYRQAIEFDPAGTMAIPDLFDEYDRCWQAYYTDSDENLARAFQLSQIGKVPEKEAVFLPRFRDVANYLQQCMVGVEEKFTQLKQSELTGKEKLILTERITYAQEWLAHYAPQEFRMEMTQNLPDLIHTLNERQIQYIQNIIDSIEHTDNPEDLQQKLYERAKIIRIPMSEAFSSIYTVLMGKTHGPKAAWLISQYPKNKVIERFREVIDVLQSNIQKTKEITVMSKPELFTISDEVKKTYRGISIGLAVISGVQISKTNPKLEREKSALLAELENLTTQEIGKYPEVVSYRKLYRSMGIDWHSRRPSPEALLRRVALKKGLYTVNTCVDAYNLVVMKYRISVGAFDYDTIVLPTILQFAKKGDFITLLGDNEPTIYTEKELAYYDGKGGYNIDFNYRDAQRTMVTEQTVNILINVDGVFDITPLEVERSLRASADKIIQYCGGTVECMGVVV